MFRQAWHEIWGKCWKKFSPTKLTHSVTMSFNVLVSLVSLISCWYIPTPKRKKKKYVLEEAIGCFCYNFPSFSSRNSVAKSLKGHKFSALTEPRWALQPQGTQGLPRIGLFVVQAISLGHCRRPIEFWPHGTPVGVCQKSQIVKSIRLKIENLSQNSDRKISL